MEVRLIAAQDYTHRDHRLLGQRNIVRQTTASNHRRIVSRKLLSVESYGALAGIELCKQAIDLA